MKNLADLNNSEGITLYAYAIDGKIVTSFMKLADLRKEAKPEGARIISAFIDKGKF